MYVKKQELLGVKKILEENFPSDFDNGRYELLDTINGVIENDYDVLYYDSDLAYEFFEKLMNFGCDTKTVSKIDESFNDKIFTNFGWTATGGALGQLRFVDMVIAFRLRHGEDIPISNYKEKDGITYDEAIELVNYHVECEDDESFSIIWNYYSTIEDLFENEISDNEDHVHFEIYEHFQCNM